MMHVVCYDISGDAVRDKVSRVLVGYGSRIQESVFECILDEELVSRLLADLGKTKLAATDKVRIYKICGKCVGSIGIYGPGEITVEPEYYLV